MIVIGVIRCKRSGPEGTHRGLGAEFFELLLLVLYATSGVVRLVLHLSQQPAMDVELLGVISYNDTHLYNISIHLHIYIYCIYIYIMVK